MRNKKAAMEMSVGTIVTIVLLMSVLILGIFLIQKIFKGASGAIDMTMDELDNSIRKLLGEDKAVVIYPSSKYLKIKHGKSDAIGVGIKNMYDDDKSSNTISYSVTLGDTGDCGSYDVSKWIKVGKTSEMILPKGQSASRKIIFEIPIGSPVCIAEFILNVRVDDNDWISEYFHIEIK
ncbi:MAG: hypothetical protein QQN41_11925 [Nitrosopumilus sp.]